MRRIFLLASTIIGCCTADRTTAAPILRPTIVIDSPFVARIDSAKDTLTYEIGMNGFMRKRRQSHAFVLTELEHPRQFTYREHFAIMDFNRVTGYFLGLGNEAMQDFGPHDEFGLHAGFGFGFASKRWEYLLGPEFRIPLESISKHAADTANHDRFFVPPTLELEWCVRHRAAPFLTVLPSCAMP